MARRNDPTAKWWVGLRERGPWTESGDDDFGAHLASPLIKDLLDVGSKAFGIYGHDFNAGGRIRRELVTTGVLTVAQAGDGQVTFRVAEQCPPAPVEKGQDWISRQLAEMDMVREAEAERARVEAEAWAASRSALTATEDRIARANLRAAADEAGFGPARFEEMARRIDALQQQVVEMQVRLEGYEKYEKPQENDGPSGRFRLRSIVTT